MPRLSAAQKQTNKIAREANERGVGPTPERLAKAGEAVEPFNSDPDKHKHYDTIRLNDSNGGILDQLIREKKISTDEYHAGLRLFRDYWLSGIEAAKALDWTRPVVDCQPTANISDKKLDAINSVKRMTQALKYAGMHPFLKMVLQGQSPLQYGRERWPLADRNHAVSLAKGAICTTLALIDEVFYGPRHARTVTARSADYKPNKAVLGVRDKPRKR